MSKRHLKTVNNSNANISLDVPTKNIDPATPLYPNKKNHGTPSSPEFGRLWEPQDVAQPGIERIGGQDRREAHATWTQGVPRPARAHARGHEATRPSTAPIWSVGSAEEHRGMKWGIYIYIYSCLATPKRCSIFFGWEMVGDKPF